MAGPGDLSTDCCVVGAGAVGASLACALARAGYRVTVLERRAPDFRAGNPERVVALNEGSRCFLEGLGLWPEELARTAGRIDRIVVEEAGGSRRVELTTAQARNIEAGVSALGHVVEMGALLAPMHAAMAGLGVELVAPCSLSGLELDGDALIVHAGCEGRARRIRARLVVAADGTSSPTRRMAGIATRGWDHNRFAIVASVRCRRTHRRVAYECFRPDGPLAFLPLGDDREDGRFSIVWTLAPEAAALTMQADDARFIALLNQALGSEIRRETGGVVETSPRAVFPLELSVAERLHAPRLVLAGNAAHTVHPVAGQGLNLGLRDVAALVRILERDVARRDPGQPIVLAAYADARRLDIGCVAGFTEALVGLYGVDLPGARMLRGMGLAALERMPALKSLLIRQAAGLGPMRAVGGWRDAGVREAA